MDVSIVLDDDSDVEIIDPEILNDHYQKQLEKLLIALKNYVGKIPRKWEDFHNFVQIKLKFSLSIDLIKSVWTELSTFERRNQKIEQIVEISDDEDVKNDSKVNRNNKNVHFCKGEFTKWLMKYSSNKEQMEEQLSEPSGESTVNSFTDDEPPDHDRSYIQPKKTRKRKKSLPITEEEKEAENLRQQLLLEQQIMLELPGVIKYVMSNHKLNEGSSKKRKKKNMNDVIEEV